LSAKKGRCPLVIAAAIVGSTPATVIGKSLKTIQKEEEVSIIVICQKMEGLLLSSLLLLSAVLMLVP